MATWREALGKDESARQSLVDRLTVLRNDAVREMEEAPTFEGVLEARGRKKVLDQLMSELRMDTREEQAYVRAFGRVRGSAA